jgi:dihydroxy-acid dehydratase
VNLQPSGKHLMEDFCYAGGLPVVMHEIAPMLHLDAVTANGKTVGENMPTRRTGTRKSSSRFPRLSRKGGFAVLRGNLAPRGAVIKPSAATPPHGAPGRAVVFENIDDFHKRIDDENLDVDENCVLCAEELRSQGLPRHGRSRQHALAAQGAAQGASPTWSASATRA